MPPPLSKKFINYFILLSIVYYRNLVVRLLQLNKLI
nr:MAG TPA: hypothetical protein [Herelleviridae sp.]